MHSFLNFEPVHCSISSSNCCFLTCIQVSQKTGKVIWYSYLFKKFPQLVLIHTVKGFSIVTVAEVDVFLEFPCFLYEPMNVGNLISVSSALSKCTLYLWKFLVHILQTASLKDFEHYLAIMWSEGNFTVACTFSGIAFLWDWNENWPFPVLWPLLSFPSLLAYWVQHVTASSFRIWNSSAEIPPSPLALFIVMLSKAH